MNGETVWNKYLDNQHYYTKREFNSRKEWCAPLSAECKANIVALSSEKPQYRQLDPSVLYAIAASRNAVRQAGWDRHSEFGINIGSSRGATTTFEKYHTQFIESNGQFVSPLTSPATTLGNIASWVAADVGANGPAISHSITCSTALHAVANAVAWLKSGLCSRFLVGGSEAPLTAFTIAQMKALRVYSSLNNPYPCRSMDPGKKQNSMILGEGAASFCLELKPMYGLAYIIGIGYGTETINHGASISANALCLQQSMQMAIKSFNVETVDAVILHSPGTIKGDYSEMNAIKAVFGQYKPLLTSNKWKIGHTFGASGAFSIEMALLMLKNNQFIQPPYLVPQDSNRPLKRILVNAVGFGGNAVSVLIEK